MYYTYFYINADFFYSQETSYSIYLFYSTAIFFVLDIALYYYKYNNKK